MKVKLAIRLSRNSQQVTHRFEEVSSLQEASSKVVEYVLEHDIPDNEWVGGAVFVDGTKVAQVHSDGRVEPVACAPAQTSDERRGPYTVEHIRNCIMTNQTWTEHALVALYRHQTDDEQRVGETREHNNVGFNGVDAPFLSSLASWILSGRSLTPRQCAAARRKLGKYARQLTLIANNGAI